MTGSAAKSAISNAGDGKAVSGAWSNHVSGCQNDRLSTTSHQFTAAGASQSRQKAWRTALGAITMPKGDPSGECRSKDHNSDAAVYMVFDVE